MTERSDPSGRSDDQEGRHPTSQSPESVPPRDQPTRPGETASGPGGGPAEPLDGTAEAGGSAQPDEATVLSRRAAALARRPREEDTGERIEATVFRLGRDLYAIELRWLQQIFPLRNLALLPGARPPVIGLTPWRGELLRLVDLNAALGRAGLGIADRGRVLAVGVGEQADFGILVDAIEDLRILNLDAVLPLPGREEGDTRPLRGVTSDAVLVLDGERLIRTLA